MKNLILVPVVLLFAAIAIAQPKEEKLLVATRLIRPFVYEQQGHLTGFSVELWQEIAKQMNAQSEFIVKPTVKELLDAVKSKNVALGIAAISITADREVELDFSQPMFDAGLQILTPVQGGRGGLVEAIVANLLSTTVLLYV
ncbi:MAG: transporter substrate-binding domain-containing protein [Deltaproteobacteria bacterium]|nr:MAG: transporter substrate-binding domain-containing protein [Deltaproteobacteria bacterium]